MLVISRKAGEVIVLGEPPNQVRLIVLGIDRGRARLGFEAPRSVPIWREELRTSLNTCGGMKETQSADERPYHQEG